MKQILLLLIFIGWANYASAKENVHPTIEPSGFGPQTEITVTYDVTGTPLADLEEAYIWVWIPGSNIDARYNVNPASGNTELTNNAKFTKSASGGSVTFTLSFVPEAFFSEPICAETELGMLIKGNDWSDGQSVDHVADMQPLSSCFAVKLNAPVDNPVFVDPGGELHVEAEASAAATFTLTVEGDEVNQQSGITDYEFSYLIPQSSGIHEAALSATSNETGDDTTIYFQYLVNEPSAEQPKPAGIVPGINYNPSDAGKATLCLLAPGKKAAYLLAEFNGFEIAPANKMYRDGDYFWKEVEGLTPGVEYAFQYLVDGVFIADPFADKILDPDDRYIPEAVYPDLKEYPQEAVRDQWYKNRLSVLQTGQEEFDWQHLGYQRANKKDLVIYELLIRDFFAEEDRNYLNLIDTLSYLKRLGVNAIELMPVQEFAGNNSWGYNPTFMFAPDKAYGAKKALKQFIDAAHGEGMAVILDVVFNHQDIPNPYVALWYDFSNFSVTGDNPMFNVEATHPYSVFYDMNHESELTQFYMDTTLRYWLDEYKIDGFRFDLSKGFTQNNTGGDVNAWGQYDASRIALLKRMGDKVWSYAPGALLILEHFADNAEEKELADHGFLLWGGMHWDYKDLAIGVGKDISWAHYGARNWEDANLVTYMESHDEQRIMYELLEYGLSEGGYDVKNFKTALDRVKLAAAFFYTVPGPKMLWQFGEFGYDLPINLCEDGSINEGCRTAPKPVKWEYYDDEARQKLFKLTQALIDLKVNHEVFESGEFSVTNDASLVKEIVLNAGKDNPENEDEMSVYLVGNFDVKKNEVDFNFPFDGDWYDFFGGGEILTAENVPVSAELDPGEFKLFVNHPVEFPETGLDPVIASIGQKKDAPIRIYPNPAAESIQIVRPGRYQDSAVIQLYDALGSRLWSAPLSFASGAASLNVRHLKPGVYFALITDKNTSYTIKLIKK